MWYYLCTSVKETLIPGIQSVCRIYQNLFIYNLRFKNHVDFCLYCCTLSVLPAVPFIPCESCLLSVASVSELEALEGGTETVGLDREIKHLNSSSRTIGSLASRSEGRFPAKTKFRLKPSFGEEFVGLCRLDESLAEKAQEQGGHKPERCQLWRKHSSFIPIKVLILDCCLPATTAIENICSLYSERIQLESRNSYFHNIILSWSYLHFNFWWSDNRIWLLEHSVQKLSPWSKNWHYTSD